MNKSSKLKQYCAALLSSILLAAGAPASAEVVLTGQGLPDNYTEVKSELRTSGPLLLFSDSPEIVYDNGILYRDTVSGDVRIFFHHVNAMDGDKKLAVLIRNKESMRPVQYQIKRIGIGKSSWNYMEDGKNSQKAYFAAQEPQQAQALGLGRSVELLTGRGFIINHLKLLTGTIDLHLDRTAEISVLMCAPETDLEIFAANAAILPMDEHPLRGTFARSDWQYTVPETIKLTKGRVQALELGGQDSGFAKGVDVTTGLAAENWGNYGVIYTLAFKVGGKEPLKLFVNAMGGYFAGWGVLESADGSKLVGMPADDLCIGNTVDEMLQLAVLQPGAYKFIWSPPGASNLPICLYWLPAAYGE